MGTLGESCTGVLFKINMEIKTVYPEDRGEEFAETERYFYYCPISGINLMYDIRSLDMPDEILLAYYSQGEGPVYVSDDLMKQYTLYENFKNLNDEEVLDIQEFLEQIYSKSAKLIKYRVIYPDGENEWTDYIYKL
jgi:hypothetical protein